MENISSAIAVPFRPGNLIHDDSAVTTQLGITGLKLIENTASLFSNPNTKSNPSCGFISTRNDPRDQSRGAEATMSKLVMGNLDNQISSGTTKQRRKEDEFKSMGDQIIDNPCSQSQGIETEAICDDDELSALAANSKMNSQKNMDLDKSIGKANLRKCDVEFEDVQDMVGVDVKDSDGSDESDTYTSTSVTQVSQDKRLGRTSSQNVVKSDCPPLWGFTSICGRRQEMEDAVAVVPRLLQIPIQLLMDDYQILNGMNNNPTHLTAHFYGVYDGHGGSQVCLQVFLKLKVYVLFKCISTIESSV